MSDTIRNQIIIFKTRDEQIAVDVRFDGETMWLSLDQIAELFERDKSTISRHIKNIFEEGELERISTVAKYATVGLEGKREVIREIEHFNLDIIISVGYRVKSLRGTQFRQWATKRIHEYIQKGFTMDDERLKNFGGGGYFKELLERIRDIRSSEKVFYRQVLDLFQTSSDYSKNALEAKQFFATVQNKMHFAIHKQTAAELIYNRVDSEKEFMGLITFKGELPTLSEAKIGKNYLMEKELKDLNRLVSGYFDFAERQAEREIVMTMKDWIDHVNRILTATGEYVLEDNGKRSKEETEVKATTEYKKYRATTLTQVEKDYLEEIREIEKLGMRKE
jgi:Virulence protein